MNVAAVRIRPLSSNVASHGGAMRLLPSSPSPTTTPSDLNQAPKPPRHITSTLDSAWKVNRPALYHLPTTPANWCQSCAHRHFLKTRFGNPCLLAQLNTAFSTFRRLEQSGWTCPTFFYSLYSEKQTPHRKTTYWAKISSPPHGS